jgi:peptidylprolyl isomerase/peptidyl-prolyl cis-trans isomerase B (cyclophilin B)
MKTKRFIKIISIILTGLIILIAIPTLAGCSEKSGSGGKFVVELYPEYAPKTVENFIKLAEEGFFDGLTFHRIVDNFMAQGGWEDADGIKKEAQSIEGEFAMNGFTQNTLSHTKGVISMARADTTAYGDPIPGYNSASSQFFIMLADNPDLDGLYAAFGKVTEGMDIVEKLQKVERKNGFSVDRTPSTPVTPVVIKKVTVLEKGDHPKIQFEMGNF